MSSPDAPPGLSAARRLPKVLLHEHLDGGLRVATLFELLQQRGMAIPAPDVPGLARWFDDRAHAGSLMQYLAGFGLTVEAMASPEALERVAFEAAEDARADGCVLAEFRIAPLLFEAFGVPPEATMEALLAGLRRSALPSGLIVCAMRQEPPAHVERVARLAVRYAGQGVLAFDLAGPELGYPPALHRGAIDIARDGGLGITLHAGEADAAERVIEAAELGATRIGHGVRLADAFTRAGGEALLDRVRELGLHLEVCPTSNVHTGAYASLADHPVAALWRAGVALSFHTDNRLMSVITMGEEADNLVRDCGLGIDDLVGMTLAAAEQSFMPAHERAKARAAVQGWASGERSAPG